MLVQPSDSTGALTPREAQVARLLAAGHSRKAIANRLSLSVRTVDTHVSNAADKLDGPGRPALRITRYMLLQASTGLPA